MLLLVISRQS